MMAELSAIGGLVMDDLVNKGADVASRGVSRMFLLQDTDKGVVFVHMNAR